MTFSFLQKVMQMRYSKSSRCDCNPISTPMECRVKLSKYDEGEEVDPIFFKSLVGSLHYLTCMRPDILYAVELIS